MALHIELSSFKHFLFTIKQNVKVPFRPKLQSYHKNRINCKTAREISMKLIIHWPKIHLPWSQHHGSHTYTGTLHWNYHKGLRRPEVLSLPFDCRPLSTEMAAAHQLLLSAFYSRYINTHLCVWQLQLNAVMNKVNKAVAAMADHGTAKAGQDKKLKI